MSFISPGIHFVNVSPFTFTDDNFFFPDTIQSGYKLRIIWSHLLIQGDILPCTIHDTAQVI